MSERHEDNDGSDIFWPGYVDATTNLILNLLFLLTILIVAVFMFALELGRSSPISSSQYPSELSSTSTAGSLPTDSTATSGSLTTDSTATTELSEAVAAATTELSEAVAAATTELSEAVTAATTELSEAVTAASADSLEADSKVTTGSLAAEGTATTEFSEAVTLAMSEFSEAVSMATSDSVEENVALKNEVERLHTLLAERVSEDEKSGGLVKTVEATSNPPKPLHGLDKTLTSDFEVIVRFKNEAVAFTPEEHDQLLESLQPIDASRKASIYVEVPAGFSEAKRMGFYRAMAVRNLLIEMKLPQENIDVAVVEGKEKANASLVRVRSY